MCEIFGVNARFRVEINEYLKTFFAHSVLHAHGWGISFHTGKDVFFHKEALAANKSAYLKRRLRFPVVESNVLAHIRYATVGSIDAQNSHPFISKDESGRTWSFIHNGTIHCGDALDIYRAVQTGQTDSERLSLHLISELNKLEQQLGRSAKDEERFELIDNVIGSLSGGNKLNLVLSDGEFTFVHSNAADTLYSLKKDDAVFFSTLPLSKEDWQPISQTRLLIFKEGELIGRGRAHGIIYKPNETERRFAEFSRELIA